MSRASRNMRADMYATQAATATHLFECGVLMSQQTRSPALQGTCRMRASTSASSRGRIGENWPTQGGSDEDADEPARRRTHSSNSKCSPGHASKPPCSQIVEVTLAVMGRRVTLHLIFVECVCERKEGLHRAPFLVARGVQIVRAAI